MFALEVEMYKQSRVQNGVYPINSLARLLRPRIQDALDVRSAHVT